MKKLLTTAFCVSLMIIGMQSVMAADSTTYTKSQTQPKVERTQLQDKEQIMPPKPLFNLEEELGLTESQKEKAKENRIKGRQEMKPIMDEIRAKKEAILDIVDSDLSKEKQQEQIKVIQNEIRELHKKANAIREKNMAEFEKILTGKQKTKFEELKKRYNPKGGCERCERRMPPPPILNAD